MGTAACNDIRSIINLISISLIVDIEYKTRGSPLTLVDTVVFVDTAVDASVQLKVLRTAIYVRTRSFEEDT